MSDPCDNEMLEYLKRRQNLAAVLEILKHADTIRLQLLNEFWSELRDYLKRKTPVKLRNTSLRWEFWPAPSGMDATYASICLSDESFKEEEQFLNFCISQNREAGYYKIRFGLQWERAVPLRSKHVRLPEVMKVREHLEVRDFKQGQWWLGEKLLREEDSVETFLIKHTCSKKMCFGEISESFWALVQDTYVLVGRANAAIQKK